MSTGVLLACAEPTLRDQFVTVLHEGSLLEIVEIVADSTSLLMTADRTDVDVIVIHDAVGPASPSQLTRELVASHPYLPVVWLTDGTQPPGDVLAVAVEAGARSVVHAPLTVETLQSRIDAAAAWGRSLLNHVGGDGLIGRRGHLVAVAGAKGGVGTTIIATLLADAAMRPTRTVVLVDLDVRNGAVAFYADVAARRSIADLADVAHELTGRSVREVVHQHPGGLSLVLAPEEVERAEDVTGDAVRRVLTQLRLQYTHIVVDCGSRLDDGTAMAIELANEVCLVTTPDIIAVRAARRAIQSWARLGLRRTDQVKVLINRVSKRTEVQPELIRSILPAAVVAEIPAGFASLEPGINTGMLERRGGPVHEAIRRSASAFGLGEPADPPRPGRGGARRRARTAAVPASGQATVEMPFLVLFLGLACAVCLQLVAWGVSHVFAEHAALEAARTRAVTADPGQLGAAVDKALPPGWNAGWQITQNTATAVAVSVQTPTIIPGLLDLPVTATASVQVEP